MRILVAMSGGVDSSVAALRLKQAGHEVIGLTLLLHTPSQAEHEPASPGCRAAEDRSLALRVAQRLEIPHHVLDLRREFEQQVVQPFVNDYVAGRTPLPCALCNTRIKFRALLDRASSLDCDRVATGHYARVDRDPTTRRCRLLRGRDRQKDQSYFLFGLAQDQLAQAEFPIGEMTKEEVRAIAAAHDLPCAECVESQELCFVSEDGYASFIERHSADSTRSGAIVDRTGRIVGRHDGIHRLTIGQRRGLGVASAQPLYVLRLDPITHTATVGAEEELLGASCAVRDVNWLSVAPPGDARRAEVKIRYRSPAAPAMIEPLADRRVHIAFDAPQRAITPGQAAVFYEDDACLGGGWIE
jgi:tRNA-specific 2-thiouridylase